MPAREVHPYRFRGFGFRREFMRASWQTPVRRKLHDARQGFRIYSQRLWFYPALLLAVALALYAVTTMLDRSLSVLVNSNSGTAILFIFTGGPDAARSGLRSFSPGLWSRYVVGRPRYLNSPSREACEHTLDASGSGWHPASSRPPCSLLCSCPP